MTTVFEAAKTPQKIDESHYVEALENVAPNITVLIASAATINEDWWDTLARVLPTIDSSPVQDGHLMTLATRAARGLDPVGYVTPIVAQTSTPMTAEKFLTYAGVAGIVWKLLF